MVQLLLLIMEAKLFKKLLYIHDKVSEADNNTGLERTGFSSQSRDEWQEFRVNKCLVLQDLDFSY